MDKPISSAAPDISNARTGSEQKNPRMLRACRKGGNAARAKKACVKGGKRGK